MSRLFIELYLDEDVDVLLAALVRARGFSARTTVEAGRRGTGDEQQLEYAAAENLTLLTHKRADFEALARRWLSTGRTHAGILIAVRRPVHDIARRLLVILNDVTAEEMQNQIRYF